MNVKVALIVAMSFLAFHCTQARSLSRMTNSQEEMSNKVKSLKAAPVSNLLKRLTRSLPDSYATSLAAKSKDKNAYNHTIKLLSQKPSLKSDEFDVCIEKYWRRHRNRHMIEAFNHCFAKFY